jgi:hypothetical protein
MNTRKNPTMCYLIDLRSKFNNLSDLQGHACIPDIQQSQTHWQTRISALFQRRPHDVKTPLDLPEEYKPQDLKFVDYLLDQSLCGRRCRRADCWHGHNRDRNLKVSGVKEKKNVAPPGVLNIRATYLL